MARPGNIHIPSLEKLVRGLLEKMEKAHYSKATIHSHLSMIRPIQTYMDAIGVTEYTPEIGHQYLDQYFATHHPKALQKQNFFNAFQFLNDHYGGKDIGEDPLEGAELDLIAEGGGELAHGEGVGGVGVRDEDEIHY